MVEMRGINNHLILEQGVRAIEKTDNILCNARFTNDRICDGDRGVLEKYGSEGAVGQGLRAERRDRHPRTLQQLFCPRWRKIHAEQLLLEPSARGSFETHLSLVHAETAERCCDGIKRRATGVLRDRH